ncbi:hypothetical protein TREES_T100001652 [Tupaia chinensis]|uniref:Uncharacterized protein n=1 Tax=Tupaia chinensis TaxID=246437 RepID=L9KK98_TUPCH|nr:hypothetical protein TREES_T100001652 [Tupaia chinensis]
MSWTTGRRLPSTVSEKNGIFSSQLLFPFQMENVSGELPKKPAQPEQPPDFGLQAPSFNPRPTCEAHALTSNAPRGALAGVGVSVVPVPGAPALLSPALARSATECENFILQTEQSVGRKEPGPGKGRQSPPRGTVA